MKFWPFRKKEACRLSDELRETLLSLFGVEPQAADSMRYVTKGGKLAGASAKLVCIFDPAAVPDARLATHTYDNMVNRKESVLFTGHVFSGAHDSGSAFVQLNDRRPS